MNENMQYLKKEKDTVKVIKTEIFFAPLLIFLPLIVGLIFVMDWYNRGFIQGMSGLEGHLIIGIIIIVGNIIFDIPFIISLKEISSIIKSLKDSIRLNRK
jgi:hypothetical protein